MAWYPRGGSSDKPSKPHHKRTPGGVGKGPTAGAGGGGGGGSYDPDTGIYTNPQGQGFSMAAPPEGAIILRSPGDRTRTPSLSEAQEYIGPQPFSIPSQPKPTLGEKIKKRLLLDVAAMGLIAPPEGTQLTGLTAIIPGKAAVWSIGGSTGAVGTIVKNTKTAKLSVRILKKVFSKKALLWYGAWASSVTIGLWGAAEAPESVAFPENKYLIADARRTGNWTLVDDAEVAKADVLDWKKWEQIAMWSPISAFVGIYKKIKGARSGAVVMSKIVTDSKKQQETGQSEEEFWKEKRQEQEESEKAVIDYYNEERKRMLEWEQEAWAAAKKAERKEEKKARNADAAFWADERARQRELEAEERRAIAEFWIAYRKKMLELYEESRPSNLNFGLL